LFREPGVHGAILTEALASRFGVHIEVTTDWDLARHLGVPRPAVDAAIALNEQLAAGTVSWAPQLREMLGFAQVAKGHRPCGGGGQPGRDRARRRPAPGDRGAVQTLHRHGQRAVCRRPALTLILHRVDLVARSDAVYR
jgi:hypothetical protein